MDDDALLDELCKYRLERRGYVIRQGSAEGLSLLDRIVKQTALYYGVPLQDIKGRSRTKNVAWARQVAMFIARQMTRLTSLEIGKEFGRDHSTALWAVRVVREAERNDAKVTKALLDIRNGLP